MKYLHYTTKTLDTIATTIAKTVSIRTYENGNSTDTRRASTKSECAKIKAVVRAALGNINYHVYAMAYNHANDAEIRQVFQTTRDTAEFTIVELIDGVNGYDTVYCPIWAMTDLLWGDGGNMADRYAEFFGIDSTKFDFDAEYIPEYMTADEKEDC